MIQFTSKLKKEVDERVEQIERSELSEIAKSLQALDVLAAAFNQLKEFILAYTFKDEEEEIYFFKEIKPRLCSHLIYYRKIYNIEMNRPVGIDKQREYLNDRLNDINKYNCKRLDFIRYYRSGSSHRDALYFLRGKRDIEQYLETFYYELDPKFSTNYDFKVAKILANDMLQAYLILQIEFLYEKGVRMSNICFQLNYDQINRPTNPKSLNWTGSKVALIELIYALHYQGVFNNGNADIRQIAEYFERTFHISLGNYYQTYLELRNRKMNPTKFLDTLREGLIRKMDEQDEK